MKLRPLLLSLVVLAPVSGLVWYLGRPAPAPQAADARLGQRVLDPAAIADAARVRIDSAGKTLELVRSSSGRWSLAGTPELPADSARLTRLITDLVSPKIERLVTSRAEKLASFELGPTSVAFLDAAGKTLLDLDLGKNADGGGRILRYGDEPKAYLARLNASLDAEPSSWRDTALAAGLNASDIASLSIGFLDTPAPVVVSRTAANQPWTSPATPAGQQVKASLVNTQVGNLATLRYTDVKPSLDPDVAAARIFPREITLTTFDGRTIKFGLTRTPEPPAKPAPAVKEGETPPPEPPAAPRHSYAEVTDSKGNELLARAQKTHAFEIGDWIVSGLPAKVADLFEPVPAPATPAATTPAAAAPSPTGPISVTTEPLTVPAPAATEGGTP